METVLGLTHNTLALEVHEYKYSMDAWSNPEDVPEIIPGTDNRGFTAGVANSSQTLSSCFGTCDDVCPDACSNTFSDF